MVGGHEQAYEGLADTNLYNPQTGGWTRGADMSVERWYPTVTQLPDGRAFVVSGDNVTLKQPGMSVPLTDASNTLPSIYNPETDAWTDLPSASRRMPLYPFMFLLPNGKLFDAGPDTTTRTFDLNTNQWQTVGTSPIDGHSAVMYRPGKILKSGTWSDPEFPGRAVTNRAAAIDMTAASPAWREAAPMEYRRSYHTLTVLPDGKVLATGGQTATDGVDPKTGHPGHRDLGSGHRHLDHDGVAPAAAALPLLGDAAARRTGHARRRSGVRKHEEREEPEIYSPPYLFKGPRPSVTSAPEHARLRPAVHRHHARRRPHPLGLSGPDGLGDAQHRHGPALHEPERPESVGQRPARRPRKRAMSRPQVSYMVSLIDDQGVPSVGQIVKVRGLAPTRSRPRPRHR